MSPSNIPTDNLYKFLCISGIVLIVSSFLSINYQQDRFATQVFSTNTDASILGSEVSQLKKKVDSLTLQDKAETTKALEEVKGYEVRLAALGSMLETNEYLSDVLRAREALADLFIKMGVALMLIGFIGWYFLLQRHLDRIVRNEAMDRGA